jgi:hypothetical protein
MQIRHVEVWRKPNSYLHCLYSDGGSLDLHSDRDTFGSAGRWYPIWVGL